MKTPLRSLAVAVAVAFLAAVNIQPARAVVPAPLFPPGFPLVCGASFTGGSLAAAVGTTMLPPALFALVASNVDPWTPALGKEHVFYEYPTTKNSSVAKVEYVPVSATSNPVALSKNTASGPYHVKSKFGTDSIRSDE